MYIIPYIKKMIGKSICTRLLVIGYIIRPKVVIVQD